MQFLNYISHTGSIHVASGVCISTEMMKHFYHHRKFYWAALH